MKEFNSKEASQHLEKLLRFYKIKVKKWRTTSSGRAYHTTREIEIPKPTNLDRFLVCMHEIKHIIDGDAGKRYEEEFACDKYALDTAHELGYTETNAWSKRMNWHTLARLAMAHNRGLTSINPKIKEWFNNVNFDSWKGQRVYVRLVEQNDLGYEIDLHGSLIKRYKREDVEFHLNKIDLQLNKSTLSDSTYGHWIVSEFGSDRTNYGEEFYNLSEIVEHYKLTV